MDTMETAFPQAVNCVLNRFTVLKMALENEFGGTETEEKAFWLYACVLEYFETHDTIYCDELELWFEDIFMEEFNVEMEEERSFRDVSELLISLHRQLKTGKVDEVVSFVHQNQKFIKAEFDFYKDFKQKEALALSQPSPMEIEETADSIECDLPTEKGSRQPIVVDEDGWSTVSSRKGRRAH